MDQSSIKPGKDVIREFIASMAADPNIDQQTVSAMERVLAAENKLSVSKFLRELEALRK